MTQPVFDCPSFNALTQAGLCVLQNLPSVVASHALNPGPGDHILDACAAPGGKTTHLATLINAKDGGRVFALDKSQNKINQIRDNCKRLGIKNVSCFVQDASKCFDVQARAGTLEPPFPAERFDKILLDAPCSGLGQRPQFVNHIGSKELASFPKLQKKIFATVVKLLKPGGSLVYSTCTFNDAENEGIVLWALKSFPELTLVPSDPSLGRPGIKIDGMTTDSAEKMQRFLWHDEKTEERSCDNDTIGFFIAKFEKRNESGIH